MPALTSRHSVPSKVARQPEIAGPLQRFFRAVLSAVAVTIAFTSCTKAQAISSTFFPGAPIVSFPNSQDRSYTTVISSNPYAQVSGVNGRSAMLTYTEWANSRNLVGIDVAGNIGILGTLSSASSRSMKKDITPYREDPLALIRAVRFVRFRYRAEAESERTHVGFIAERTPSDLSGSHHNAFNINNSLAVNMAATQALDREIKQLQAEVRALRAQVGKNALRPVGVRSPQATR